MNPADQLVVAGINVFKLMGFIDNQHIIIQVQNNLRVFRSFGSIDGGYDEVIMLPVFRTTCCHKPQSEFVL